MYHTMWNCYILLRIGTFHEMWYYTVGYVPAKQSPMAYP